MRVIHLHRPPDNVKSTNGRKLWRSADWWASRRNSEPISGGDNMQWNDTRNRNDLEANNQSECFSRKGERPSGRQENCYGNKGQQQQERSYSLDVPDPNCHEKSCLCADTKIGRKESQSQHRTFLDSPTPNPDTTSDGYRELRLKSRGVIRPGHNRLVLTAHSRF